MTTLNDTERQFAEQLLLAVKNREFTVTYGKLAERVVPPANPRNVGRNIENISILCHVLGLPLLSAMVVNKQSQRAGEGFYPLYEKLGIPIEGRTEAELCYQEHTAIYDCANWYKLEDALGLQVGMPRPQRTWLYIKPDKAEYCFHAVERILTTKYHQDGDPLTLSFSAGEMGRRERYKYDVINKGREMILGISWEDPSIVDGNLVSQAASNALTVFPDGWDRQQNLVDWRDINFIWDKEPTRAFKLCEDIVTHYETNRAQLLTGKAMIVAYSRPIAMKIYRKILELRPGWKEKVGVVMTGGNSDPEDWKPIIGTKAHKEELARKFKDNDDPMKIAIVVDMWLTGFDVPSLATMYVYKPMHGYNLMQAIARVNRVFKDKEGGLIVDYVGIASALRAAMNEYTSRDRRNYGDMDIAKTAYPKFKEKLEVCKDLFHGFDFSGFFGGSPLTMAKLIAGGANYILDPKTPATVHVQDGQGDSRKDLYLKEALLLKQAHSLCSSLTTEAERHYAAYFEAVRATVSKLTTGGKGGKMLSLSEINAQINELLKASIQSEGVINLFDSKQHGEKFSLFDPAVLEEIGKMKEKNIAVEILRKLMAEQVSIYKRTNVVQSQKFSEKITQLMNAYYNGLITNEEVIKELLETAAQIAALHKQGETLGLTEEEMAVPSEMK